MTDSRPLTNSQTAAEGLQSSIFVLELCLLAEMYPQWCLFKPSQTAAEWLQSGIFVMQSCLLAGVKLSGMLLKTLKRLQRGVAFQHVCVVAVPAS